MALRAAGRSGEAEASQGQCDSYEPSAGASPPAVVAGVAGASSAGALLEQPVNTTPKALTRASIIRIFFMLLFLTRLFANGTKCEKPRGVRAA